MTTFLIRFCGVCRQPLHDVCRCKPTPLSEHVARVEWLRGTVADWTPQEEPA